MGFWWSGADTGQLRWLFEITIWGALTGVEYCKESWKKRAPFDSWRIKKKGRTRCSFFDFHRNAGTPEPSRHEPSPAIWEAVLKQLRDGSKFKAQEKRKRGPEGFTDLLGCIISDFIWILGYPILTQTDQVIFVIGSSEWLHHKTPQWIAQKAIWQPFVWLNDWEPSSILQQLGLEEINYQYWLVVWNMNFIFPSIGNVIIPTEEVHHFSDGQAQPPSRTIFNHQSWWNEPFFGRFI